MKKSLLIVLAILAMVGSAYAQEAQISDIRKKEFKGVQSLLNPKTRELIGYYTFYVSEKLGNGMVEFNLDIFDTNLNLVKRNPLEINKYAVLSSSVFNGENFIFAFTNYRKKDLHFYTFDSQGNKLADRHIESDKRYTTDATVYAAENGGFLIIRPIKERKVGYSIERVNSDLSSVWEQRIVPTKGYVGVQNISADKGRVIVTQLQKPSMLSRKEIGEITTFSDKDGQQGFTYSLFNGENTIMPTTFLVDTDNNLVTSGMYFKGQKWDAVNSDGIFFLKLSANGKELVRNIIEWKGDIQKYLKASSSKTSGFAIGSKPKVFFQSIVETSEGYRVIGETFRKNLNAGGRGLALLKAVAGTGHSIGWDSNDDPVYTFEVMDLMLFNFQDNGDMVGMTHIPKPHTKITVTGPYNNYAGLAMAFVVAEFGYFDYCFTQSNPATDEIIIVSRALEKNPQIAIHKISGNTFETETVGLKRMPGSVVDARVGAMQGTNNRMCLYFYDKKEKKLTLYLEELDVNTLFTSTK